MFNQNKVIKIFESSQHWRECIRDFCIIDLNRESNFIMFKKIILIDKTPLFHFAIVIDKLWYFFDLI